MVAMQAPGLDDNDCVLTLHLFKNARSKIEKTFIRERYLDPLVTQWHGKHSEDTKSKSKARHFSPSHIFHLANSTFTNLRRFRNYIP